jgi:hypothetical protein
MVKCGVLFEVRTEFLNVTYMNFGLTSALLCPHMRSHVGYARTKGDTVALRTSYTLSGDRSESSQLATYRLVS